MRPTYLLLAAVVGLLAAPRPTAADPPLPLATMHVTADNVIDELWINGRRIELDAAASDWTSVSRLQFAPMAGDNVVALRCTDQGVIAGLLASIEINGATLVTGESWLVSTDPGDGWYEPAYDDSRWTSATPYGEYTGGVWGPRVQGMPPAAVGASWIWTATNTMDGAIDTPVYFRLHFSMERIWMPVTP